MARILCNLPLECFEERAKIAAAGFELVTYGPAHRVVVDRKHYPPDIEFDPISGTIHELLAALPKGFVPDFVLIYWPDQDPIPRLFHECPVPTVGVMSDYNLTLHYVAGLWPFFDVMLCDRGGVALFDGLSFAATRYFCQYSFKVDHKLYPDETRDLDVGFVGNVNPIVQAERAPWIRRLLNLNNIGIGAEVHTKLFGESCGRFLNQTRIGFNRTIRHEMNLRAFEIPACGALMFIEAENKEVAEFLVPGEEVVLYHDDDFEDLVREHLDDEPRREMMARAGYERIQNYSMSRRLPLLAELVQDVGIQRPQASEFEIALGRGTAIPSTWAPGIPAVQDLVRAIDLQPEDPRPLNTLALALLQADSTHHSDRVINLLEKAMSVAPDYVPAATNLTRLLDLADHPRADELRAELDRRIERAATWTDLDGLALPIGFSAESIAIAHALATAIREDDLAHLKRAYQVPAPGRCVPEGKLLTS